MSGNLLAITSSTPMALVSTTLGTSADAAVYTVASATTVKITSATVCNTTATAATVFIGICLTGTSGGVTHRCISGYSLAAGDTLSLDCLLGVQLGPADFIIGHSGTASAINIILTGIVST